MVYEAEVSEAAWEQDMKAEYLASASQTSCAYFKRVGGGNCPTFLLFLTASTANGHRLTAAAKGSPSRESTNNAAEAALQLCERPPGERNYTQIVTASASSPHFFFFSSVILKRMLTVLHSNKTNLKQEWHLSQWYWCYATFTTKTVILFIVTFTHPSIHPSIFQGCSCDNIWMWTK